MLPINHCSLATTKASCFINPALIEYCLFWDVALWKNQHSMTDLVSQTDEKRREYENVELSQTSSESQFY